MAEAGRLLDWVQDEYVPFLGQFTFILTAAPLDLESLTFMVNGVAYDDVSDFTVSGVTITWLGFQLDSLDKVLAKYLT